LRTDLSGRAVAPLHEVVSGSFGASNIGWADDGFGILFIANHAMYFQRYVPEI